MNKDTNPIGKPPGSENPNLGMSMSPWAHLAAMKGNWRQLESWIGPSLRGIRLLISRMSQKELAEELDRRLNRYGTEPLDRSYVSKVESGKKTLSLNRFLAWCDALGRDPAYVVQYAAMLAATADREVEELKEDINDHIEQYHPDVTTGTDSELPS